MSELIAALTDDELYAIEQWQERRWPTPRPTVLDGEVEHQRATARGWRSLIVRGLVSDNGATRGLELVASLCHTPPVVRLSYVASDLSVRQEHPTLLVHSVTGEWVLETVDVTGTHVFASADAREIRVLINSLIDSSSAREDGLLLAVIARSTSLGSYGLVTGGPARQLLDGRQGWEVGDELAELPSVDFWTRWIPDSTETAA